MNILITGASGQLGSEIKELSKGDSKNKYFFEGSKTLDITNFLKVESFIKKNNINAVINCGAYTAVDKAEEEQEQAWNVNVNGVENIARAIKKTGGKLIHISTDYVFSGQAFQPYQENDAVNPLGVYGKTKRLGEEKLLELNFEAIIIRTSWLYSSYGANFLKTMLRLGKDRQELGVIFDQVGSPTYARDLAETCLKILSSDKKIDMKSKTYHYSNEGIASWYDFAKAIFEIASIDCKVNPIETKDYPTPAKRPNYSVLNKSKIKKDFDVKIPYWRDSLKECIKKIEDSK